MKQRLFKITHRSDEGTPLSEFVVGPDTETALVWAQATLESLGQQQRRVVMVEELGECFVCGVIPPAAPVIVARVNAAKAKRAEVHRKEGKA